MAAFKVDVSAFKQLAQDFDSPSVKQAVRDIARDRAIPALISQAIADNFHKEGPGWPPLKIRKGKMLRKTNLLFKSVTTPGAPGNIYRNDGSVITWGTNLLYAAIHNDGGVITAKKAKMLFIPLTPKGQKVGPQKGKAAQKSSGLKYGRDFIFKKSVRIPARPFLTISDSWMEQIYQYALEKMVRAIVGGIK